MKIENFEDSEMCKMLKSIKCSGGGDCTIFISYIKIIVFNLYKKILILKVPEDIAGAIERSIQK